MSRILVIEDNKAIAAAVQYNLQMEGHTVEVAKDGRAGVARALELRPDLVVLDLMLPEIDGYAVLEILRSENFMAPVLILSALGEETDKVRGFRSGADQYLTKPFGLMELLERVRGLLRRWSPVADVSQAAGRNTTRFGDVEIDAAARTVRRAGRDVPVSPKAFDLLLALARRDGAVASRLELLQEVWGHRGAVMTRTVDAHVKELRHKLEDDPAQPRHILTARKAGYRLVR